jgi:hypothetical protein
MKTSIRAALIALAIFCCVQAFAWTPLRLAVAFQSVNSGTINAVNATGFTAPPSSTNVWTTGSYVQLSNTAPGNQLLTISVNSSAFLGTLGVYYSPDGSSLLQPPATGILCNETGAYGAIGTGTATYSVVVPPGTYYVACSAYTSGSASVTVKNGPAYAGAPGYMNGSMVSGFLPWQTATWNSSTSTGTSIVLSSQNMTTAVVTLNGSGSFASGKVSFWASDGTNWIHLPGSVDGTSTGSSLTIANSPYTPSASQIQGLRFNVAGYQQFKITLSTAITAGTLTVNASAQAGNIADRVVAISGVASVNGGTNLNTFSGGGEASNSVTTSPAVLTLSGGSDPALPLFVIVTNTGPGDAWVSPVSGGHTWLCPAGVTTYIPSGSTALYGLAVTTSTTLYCIKAGI